MKFARTAGTQSRPGEFSVTRLPSATVLRFHERDTLAGADLGKLSGLWEFFKVENRQPSPVLVVLAPPDLLSPRSLEKLLCEAVTNGDLDAGEVSERIIREENVIQRFITNVRELDSFVVGVAGGNIAFPLAATLLACDYRIVSSDSAFVNTTQTLPRAPLNCLPWLLVKLVGGARASRLLLEVPRLSAEDAHELGLVNHVTPPDRLEEEAIEVAERLSSLPRATLLGLKRAIVASGEDFKPYASFEQGLTQKLASPHWKET